jgi:HK97 family phage prohead protease
MPIVDRSKSKNFGEVMENKPDYIKTMIPGAERRFVYNGLEVRKAGENPVFRGYAAKFNTLSNDLGGFKERIAPGFFDSVLGMDIRALRDHEPSLILGRTTSGTCRVGVDEVGLWFEYDDPGTSYSRDLAISINRGDVNQCSFAFSIPMEGGDVWEKQMDGSYIRTLLRANGLYDVSAVTYPAYEDTSVAQRGYQRALVPAAIEDVNKDLAAMDLSIAKIRLNKLKK